MTNAWCAIPVLNNAATIADIVRRSQAQIPNVLVVDDGSTDADLHELLGPLGVTVIRHPTNHGKGAALQTALNFAKEQAVEFLITLDGDGQHFPEDIPRFLENLSPESIAIGSRSEIVGAMPRSSRFGREFSDFWIYTEAGFHARDTQSGFRAYPVRRISQLSLHSRHYNFEVEVVTRALWAGLKIHSVPIRVQYLEEHNRTSSFRPVLDNARISLVHTRLVLRQLLPLPHRRIVASEQTESVLGMLAGNSTPMGLAAAAGISLFLGILLWPWGWLAAAYLAVRLHFNKIIALIFLLPCLTRSCPTLCAAIGDHLVSLRWAWFVGAHIVAFVSAPLAALLVYLGAHQLAAPEDRA